MLNGRVKVNAGMWVALGLLAVGAPLMFLEGHVDVREGLLHTAGFGILILSSVVYLAARVWMLMRPPSQ